MKNQVFKNNLLAIYLSLVAFITMPLFASTQTQSGAAVNQEGITLKQIQWKSEQQVRSLMGDPDSIKGPVGTHAAYTLWHYPNVAVAFANKRVFHLFRKDSLRKLQLE